MINNKLRSGNVKQNCQNKKVFTESTSFTVPEGVTQIFVSGCAAGGSGGSAGDFCINKAITVIPKETIDITVGNGNTIIGNYKTLIANSFGGSIEISKLGYLTGKTGTRNAPSGAFGFGGGHGGTVDRYSGSSAPEGAGIGHLFGEVVNSGGGTQFGSKGGGRSSEYSRPDGGAAGGYGAGGGSRGFWKHITDFNNGDGSPGIVIIEW